VIIDLRVLKPVREIVLNALDLTITRAILLKSNEPLDKGTTLETRIDTNQQTLTLTLPVKIGPAGVAFISNSPAVSANKSRDFST